MSVYFARVHGYVKVGYSGDVLRRLETITARSSLKPADVGYGDFVDLLGVIPGDRARERGAHSALRDHHVVGEWFWFVPEVEDYARSDPHWMSTYEFSPALEAKLVAGISKDVAQQQLRDEHRARYPDAANSPLTDWGDLEGWYQKRDEEDRAVWRARTHERLASEASA